MHPAPQTLIKPPVSKPPAPSPASQISTLLPGLLLLLLVGCGYHLGDIRPTPMRSVKVLAVPSFKNETYRPRLEHLASNTLIHTLQADGTYQIGNFNQADAVLYGTIKDVQRAPIRSALSDVLQTTEYRLIVQAAYEVQDRITGVVLKSGTATGITTFFPTGDLVTDERQALSSACQDLAMNLTRQIAEGW